MGSPVQPVLGTESSGERGISIAGAATSNVSIVRGRLYLIRTIAYWTLTLIIAWEMMAGSIWDLLQIEYVRVIFAHLGYPLYMLSIIGVWKLPCAVTLLVPRFPRLKEWAYAGAFFNYSGATASHLLAGDDAVVWIGPAAFATFTLASWALRPPDRRLPSPGQTTATRAFSWIVPIGVLAVLLVSAALTLPVGPPPPWAYGNPMTGR
jgi:hypothetical protein